MQLKTKFTTLAASLNALSKGFTSRRLPMQAFARSVLSRRHSFVEART
jgi:hypothetical protein